MNRAQLTVVALIGLAVLILQDMPNRVGRYEIFVLYTLLLNVALAQSWNLVGGYTGLISLGHAGFFGIGAYTAVICMRTYDWAFEPAVAAGSFMAMLFAVVIAFPTFRFRGVYFAIGTLTLGEALRIWMINWKWTGGAQGMRFPIREVPGSNEFYPIMLGVAAGVTLLVYFISQSRLGLGLRAIRDNEHSAQNMGVNIFRTKLAAFAISALTTGMVGAIHGARLTTIEPYSIFGVSWTISMVNMAIIGGMGTVLGPIFGASFITLLDEVLKDYYQYHLIITGVVLILVIRFMPQGIWGWLRDAARSHLPKRRELRNVPEERHAA